MDSSPRAAARAHRRSRICTPEGHSIPAALWTLLLVAVVLLPAPSIFSPHPDPISPSASPVIREDLLAGNNGLSLGGLAGSFIENGGQVRNGEVRYYVVAGDLRIGMVPSGLLVEILGADPKARSSDAGRWNADPGGADGEPPLTFSLLRVAFEGSNRVAPQARDPLPFRTNYFAGRDPAAWQTGIASYRDVVYADLYDGIDLVYHADAAGLKYEFLVRPGADPGIIRWSYAGAAGLEILDGALLIRTDAGEIRDAPPTAYQGGRDVRCRYALEGSSVGLVCDGWNPGQALTIDPLLYSTFLGGSQYSRGVGIAVDASGDAFVTGYTASVDFPTTPGAYRTTYAGGLRDVFVAKLNSSGTGLVYASFLGGSATDRAFAIAVDGAGDATVAGYTNSTDFPVTPGAFRTIYSGGEKDAFVATLNPAGSALLYSTFLGGDFDDRAYAVALGPSGDAFVAGLTNSPDFRVTPGAFQTTFANATCGLTLCEHGFLAELNANGTDLVYASFLGGASSDRVLGVAVDASGTASVVGYTNSSDFPVTSGAFSTTFHGGGCGAFTCGDAFVAKVEPSGSRLVYATFLGGSKADQGHEIAIDGGGNAYVTGETNSTDFPVTSGAFETTYRGAGAPHAFVAALNPSGSALVWATFLGGSNGDHGQGIALDASGDAVVVGWTNSSDFPTTPGAVDTAFSGGGVRDDAFVSELSPTGGQLLYSTFLGGTSSDWGNAVALDAAGDAYVIGQTESSDFPTTPGAFRTAYAGAAAAFVAMLNLTLAPTVRITSPSPGAVATTSVTVAGTASHSTLVQVRIDGGAWMTATGVASWTATYDLTPFSVGSLVVQAVAYNGTLGSAPDAITIQKTSATLMMDRCTVRPGVAAIQVGGTQAFAASGWDGTTEIAGVAATWSVAGGIGTIDAAGVFTATTAGSGSVYASATYGGRSATCSVNVTVTAGPPPTVGITSPSSGSGVTTDTVVVRGTSAHADAVQVRAGTETWVNAASNGPTWVATLDLSAFPTGQWFSLEARAYNGTIESTHDVVTLFKVFIPTVAIVSPLDHARVAGILTVRGTATPGSTVQVRFDGGLWQNLSATDGTWRWAIDTTATFDGVHLIEAQAVVNSSASSIASRTIVVSNANPLFSIFSPPLVYYLAVAVGLVLLVALILGIARRRRRRKATSSVPVARRIGPFGAVLEGSDHALSDGPQSRCRG